MLVPTETVNFHHMSLLRLFFSFIELSIIPISFLKKLWLNQDSPLHWDSSLFFFQSILFLKLHREAHLCNHNRYNLCFRAPLNFFLLPSSYLREKTFESFDKLETNPQRDIWISLGELKSLFSWTPFSHENSKNPFHHFTNSEKWWISPLFSHSWLSFLNY